MSNQTKIRNTTADILAHGSVFDTLPAAIVASERAGQRDLERAQQFPADMGDSRAAFERMGLVFIGPTEGDPIFLDCRFPAGWHKRGTDHAMWSDLLDDKGRKRGAIFYKAAFYDRSARAVATRRFRVTTHSFENYTKSIGYVLDQIGPDGDRVIYISPTFTDAKGEWDAGKLACEACVAWCAEHVPGYADPCAHWEDAPLPTVGVFPSWDAE